MSVPFYFVLLYYYFIFVCAILEQGNRHKQRQTQICVKKRCWEKRQYCRAARMSPSMRLEKVPWGGVMWLDKWKIKNLTGEMRGTASPAQAIGRQACEVGGCVNWACICWSERFSTETYTHSWLCREELNIRKSPKTENTVGRRQEN